MNLLARMSVATTTTLLLGALTLTANGQEMAAKAAPARTLINNIHILNGTDKLTASMSVLIERNKIANFTVLEEDPYAVAPMHLKDIGIWGTVFEGSKFPIAK